MRDSMRKKSAKTESNPDVTSPSSDSVSVSTNPWADAPVSQDSSSISRQTSRASKGPDPVRPPPEPATTVSRDEPSSSNVKAWETKTSRSPDSVRTPQDPPAASLKDISSSARVKSPEPKGSRNPDPVQTPQDPPTTAPKEEPPSSTVKAPEANGEDPQTPPKTTKRKKTITKTPHTFELTDDLKPVQPKVLQPAPIEEKPESSNPISRLLKRQSRPPEKPPSLSYSKVTTVLNVRPVKPKNGPPAAQSVPTSPVSPNPFTLSHHHRKSSSHHPQLILASGVPNPCRFSPPTLNPDKFFGKVVVLTNGASLIGSSIVRQFHAAGSRVIFGDANADEARKLIKTLGPPHCIHFNKCDMRRYGDMLDLFKLAVSMYGRVDHAILGVTDDGGHVASVGEGERGWFENSPRSGIEGVERDPGGLADTLAAAARFVHIALAYLKTTPKPKKRKGSAEGQSVLADRSLTVMTSIASFKETPGLPIYQIAQHGLLGLMRSLRLSVDPDKDGVRLNTVVTNMMVARAVAQAGGRMSVQLPADRPEDVARVVVGVVAAGSAGVDSGNGIWYEQGSEKGDAERNLHGRVVYVTGGECWDVQEGLDRSALMWLGSKPCEALTRAQEGLGRGNQWILHDAYVD